MKNHKKMEVENVDDCNTSFTPNVARKPYHVNVKIKGTGTPHIGYIVAFTIRYPYLREIYFYKQQISDD